MENTQPILLDFYADWCGSCQTMKEVIEDLERKAGDHLVIMKINVDEQPVAAAAFRIKSVPSFLLIRNGETLWRRSGMLSRRELEDMLKEEGVYLSENH